MISTMIIIVGIIVLLYFLLFSSSKRALEGLRTESEIVPLRVTSTKDETENSVAFVVDGKVNKIKLKDLANMEYEQLKAKLGIKNEFCIFFEDKDNNLIDISTDIEKAGVAGIGSPDFDISGFSCG